MVLRCVIDGLLLPAEVDSCSRALIAHDGEESFSMDALEAHFYELVEATSDEVIGLQKAGYRLLRMAWDFRHVETT